MRLYGEDRKPVVRQGALPKMRKILTIPALLGILLITAPGYALERVTLLNGFEMRCHHHVQDGEKTRLYLNNGDESFIELNTGEIGSF